MEFKYYTLKEYEQEEFYKTPKILFELEQYKGLGLAEKLLYGIMLDRQKLAVKDKQVDADGNVYFLYRVDELSKICNVLPETIARYRKKLVKFGLLREVKQGVGKPNRNYLARL